MTKAIKVAHLRDIPPGSMKTFNILNHEILIMNFDGILYALEARCPHKNYPLKLGSLMGRVLKCGFHYAEFDVPSGKILSQPIGNSRPIKNLKKYNIKVENSEVFVEISNS